MRGSSARRMKLRGIGHAADRRVRVGQGREDAWEAYPRKRRADEAHSSGRGPRAATPICRNRRAAARRCICAFAASSATPCGCAARRKNLSAMQLPGPGGIKQRQPRIRSALLPPPPPQREPWALPRLRPNHLFLVLLIVFCVGSHALIHYMSPQLAAAVALEGRGRAPIKIIELDAHVDLCRNHFSAALRHRRDSVIDFPRRR